MKARTLLLLLSLALTALFVALNWGAILAPTSLNLIFADIQAPLGLVLLALTGFLVLMFGVYVLFLQSHVLMEARAHAKELQGHRKLADEAEASRFTELRAFLEARFEAQDAAQAAVLERLAALGQRVHRTP